jgi:hypothetical protein
MGKHDVGRRRGLYRRVVVRRRRSSFVVVRRMYVVDVPIKRQVRLTALGANRKSFPLFKQ